MRESGIALICFGLLLLVIAIFAIDTSVSTSSYLLPDRVHNLGRMQGQNQAFMAGLGSVLGGIVLLAAGTIERTISPTFIPPADQEPDERAADQNTGQHEPHSNLQAASDVDAPQFNSFALMMWLMGVIVFLMVIVMAVTLTSGLSPGRIQAEIDAMEAAQNDVAVR